MPATAIQSQLFGRVEVADDQTITLPEGLIGFPACKTFALIPAGTDGFTWLQSMEEQSLAMLLVDPFSCFPEYSIDLPAPVVERLGAREAHEVNVQAVVTLGPDGATANLQGPLLFNVNARSGYQFVVQSSRFGTRERIDIRRAGDKSAG